MHSSARAHFYAPSWCCYPRYLAVGGFVPAASSGFHLALGGFPEHWDAPALFAFLSPCWRRPLCPLVCNYQGSAAPQQSGSQPLHCHLVLIICQHCWCWREMGLVAPSSISTQALLILKLFSAYASSRLWTTKYFVFKDQGFSVPACSAPPGVRVLLEAVHFVPLFGQKGISLLLIVVILLKTLAARRELS